MISLDNGIIEDDLNNNNPGKWLALYENGKEDPTFVFRCVFNFTLACLQSSNVTIGFRVELNVILIALKLTRNKLNISYICTDNLNSFYLIGNGIHCFSS